MTAHNILKDSRFAGIEPFESKVWLASPTMHGEEQYWVDDAIKKNWVSTVGANINEIESYLKCEKHHENFQYYCKIDKTHLCSNCLKEKYTFY